MRTATYKKYLPIIKKCSYMEIFFVKYFMKKKNMAQYKRKEDLKCQRNLLQNCSIYIW